MRFLETIDFRENTSYVWEKIFLNKWAKASYKNQSNGVNCDEIMDVQRDFDNVVSEILLEKLVNVGCSQLLINFVQHMTYERLVISEVNKDKPRKVCEG